jgi:hypothetical protein
VDEQAESFQKPPAWSRGESSPVQTLFEAHKAVIADDEVVDQLDVELLACLHKLLGHSDVFGPGRRVAAWMVVANKNAQTVRAHCRAVGFRGTQDRTIDGSLVAADVLGYMMLYSQYEDAHPFSYLSSCPHFQIQHG